MISCDEGYKTLMKEIQYDTQTNGKDSSCSFVGRINIAKIAIYKFNAILTNNYILHRTTKTCRLVDGNGTKNLGYGSWRTYRQYFIKPA